MKLKLDENGHVVVDENGLPIFIKDEDGTEVEVAVDVPGLFSKIGELNNESKSHRLKRNEYLELLKPLLDAGYVDKEKIVEFMTKASTDSETISNFDEKDFKSAKEVEAIKNGVKDSYEGKIKETAIILNQMKVDGEAALSLKDVQIRKLLVKGAFDRSKFISEGTVLLSDIAFDSFGKHFAVEEDGEDLTIIANDKYGEKIFSKANPGEYAKPEEAIEIIIKGHTNSKELLRASSGGDDINIDPSKKLDSKTNAQLAGLPPSERLKILHRQGIKT